MTHESTRNKHDTLCNIVAATARALGHRVDLHQEYRKGELDVLIDNYWYLECKCHLTPKGIIKGTNQIYRARSYGLIQKGSIIAYDGSKEII